MARLLALNALFFMIPFAAYTGWLLLTRRTLGTSADWSNRNVVILTSIGGVLMVVGLVVLTTWETSTPVDAFVPGEFEDRDLTAAPSEGG